MTLQHLPTTWEECRKRGFAELDILLVTGDVYVDHPAFGVALIGRILEQHGYRVAVLAQPRYDSPKDFLAFPEPRLFCGITAGNLDSIVANYSGNSKVREHDAFSPGGQPWRSAEKSRSNRYRPDRACLIYANLARAAYANCPIVLGGLEASLRRFVHYDYQQDKLRGSFLTDAKADLLVYGMGERPVLDIARRCAQGKPLHGIPGCCERLTQSQLLERYPDCFTQGRDAFLILPSFNDIQEAREHFLDAELAVDRHARAASTQVILQKQQSHWLVQQPAPSPLRTEELDALYSLPFTRRPHPSTPDVPAYRMIRNSITIVRGCSGNCSFCAITRHQGAAVLSRSVASIVAECTTLAAEVDFDGTISDLGGPTANLFGTSCALGSCRKRDCLYPEVCRHLQIDETGFIKLLDAVGSLDNVRHVFVSSGLRMGLLLRTPLLLRKLLADHLPGAMKIAPEHSCDDVLKLMHKEPHRLLQEFTRHCRALADTMGKRIRFVPYVISAHPGSTEEHASKLARDMSNLDLTVTKFQDFTPTPGTLSTAMYVAGRDPATRNTISVAKNAGARLRQRKIIEERFPRSQEGGKAKAIYSVEKEEITQGMERAYRQDS